MNAIISGRKKKPFSIFILVLWTSLISASAFISADTCTANDLCQTAVLFPDLTTDGDFVCIEGCTINASPDAVMNTCAGASAPTVWYKVVTNASARLMNIKISSLDSLSPVFMVFKSGNNCNTLIPVTLTQSHITCAYGPNGIAEAFGTDIEPNSTYYIAVSGLFESQGKFDLCINVLVEGSICVTDRNIEITARSAGGPLNGPFNPGETISICMNVKSYNGSANGCQWFQGLVPVFGNGWDPSSFDANGQPKLASMNGSSIGLAGNGLYGASTWDWFTDVDYHYDDQVRQLGDFDGNGTVDMCSIAFDPDCPDIGGIDGGCCGPCWGAPLGDILPPGWFAYGINGTCPTPGPPVSVDWGDGNTCGGGMGPWKFCFDLVVRKHPDCSEEQSGTDLSLSFFTFADGETGSWTGLTSLCALDQPAMLNLPFVCAEQTDLGVEVIADQCSGSIFEYTLNEPGVSHWTWSIQPAWPVLNSIKEGDNGFLLEDKLYNPMSTPVEVTYFFTGYLEGTQGTVVKQVRFQLIPEVKTTLPAWLTICEKNQDTIVISPEPLSGGVPPFTFLWSPGGQSTSSVILYPPLESSLVTLDITDHAGCIYHDEVRIQVKPCQLDTISQDDDSNETYTFEDGPIGGGKISNPFPNLSSSLVNLEDKLRVYPIPAHESAILEWSFDLQKDAAIEIYNSQGIRQDIINVTSADRNQKQIDMRTWSPGIYVISLSNSDFRYVTKLVKL